MYFNIGDKLFLHEVLIEITRYYSRYTNYLYGPLKLANNQRFYDPKDSKIFIWCAWSLSFPLNLLVLYWKLVDYLFHFLHNQWITRCRRSRSSYQPDVYDNGPRRINARKDRFMCINYDYNSL